MSPVAEVSPRARRLATPSWLDVRLVAGVLLVLLCVVIGARVFAAAGHYEQVYVARSALVPGEHLHAGDLMVGEVRFAGHASSYVAAGHEPVGYVVTRYVAAGELVPAGALAASADAAAASRFVTVPVSTGHVPADLGRGDLVDVYLTAKRESGASASPVQVLAAVPVDSYDDGADALSDSGDAAVVLAVPAGQAGDLVHAVESGTIDLVRLPEAAAAVVSSPAPVGSS
jgi:hypothetical protein